eukprot:1482564-Rhodomonas_salina.1
MTREREGGSETGRMLRDSLTNGHATAQPQTLHREPPQDATVSSYRTPHTAVPYAATHTGGRGERGREREMSPRGKGGIVCVGR